jgi:hypothetical protein
MLLMLLVLFVVALARLVAEGEWYLVASLVREDEKRGE